MLNIVIDNPKIEKFFGYSSDNIKRNLEILCEKQMEKKTAETLNKFHELNNFLSRRNLRVGSGLDIYKMIKEVNAQ